MTGGFLADLDIRFAPGLNVIVGPRGAGKTTLLELIRHALGIAHADQTRVEGDARRIRSMLGDGEVVLDVEFDGTPVRLVVDATGGGRRPELRDAALMLGQNELEAIASDAESRLRLIDMRAGLHNDAAISRGIDTFTHQMFNLRLEIADLADRMRQRPLLEADLEAALAAEDLLMKEASADMVSRRELLTEVESELSSVQAGLSQMETLSELLIDAEHAQDLLSEKLLAIKNFPKLLRVARVTNLSEDALKKTIEARKSLIEAIELIYIQHAEDDLRQLSLRAKAEPLRSALDKSEKGLGDLTSQIRNVRAQLSGLDLDQRALDEKRLRYAELMSARQGQLKETERLIEQQFERRLQIASEVSDNLSTHATVVVEHLANSKNFRDFLLSNLQGSGLRYAAIAESFANTLLPQQLVELVERQDIETTSIITDLPSDRVARALNFLNEPDVLSALAELRLNDKVDFLLVDGATTKSVEQLSTGQKCAVTLPILLTEHSRSLILDQPEDHLDNAYLVKSIVNGLVKRSQGGAQTIIATHNANIPVLGSAANVILLESDGRRGTLSRVGAFNQTDIVETITSLMEGGKTAFSRRADFYSEHGALG